MPAVLKIFRIQKKPAYRSFFKISPKLQMFLKIAGIVFKLYHKYYYKKNQKHILST